MEKPVIILGAKGLGKVALDIFVENNVIVYCMLDDDDELHNTEIGDVSILGATDDEHYLGMIGKDCEAFIASNETEYKRNLVDLLKEGHQVVPINAIHQQSYIAKSAVLGHGNLINAKASINAYARLGNFCVVNTNATIDYEATIGDFVQVGTGTIINSAVVIEDNVFIGAGAVIISGVTIRQRARIGAGSLVIAEVKAKQTVFGNPAKPL